MKITTATFLWFILSSNFSFAQTDVNIIPKPVNLAIGTGFFNMNNATSIQFANSKRELKPAADFLTAYIHQISGYTLKTNGKTTNSIILELVQNTEIGEEGYLLKVTNSSIKISATTKAGIIYGMQSLSSV